MFSICDIFRKNISNFDTQLLHFHINGLFYISEQGISSFISLTFARRELFFFYLFFSSTTSSCCCTNHITYARRTDHKIKEIQINACFESLPTHTHRQQT
ncbi:hypothetical protein RHMOL_Rhmol06G0087600 [Rhododendron molle]|uniref:Uncharacterized protein n=1 Tax=Rhododendron molle TaxID=49168 RepID=A0ACC0NBW4_RHOML|nr:hypothetical protein RHMOL_Rhmol06G0087600 [Rhododendron molle]